MKRTRDEDEDSDTNAVGTSCSHCADTTTCATTVVKGEEGSLAWARLCPPCYDMYNIWSRVRVKYSYAVLLFESGTTLGCYDATATKFYRVSIKEMLGLAEQGLDTYYNAKVQIAGGLVKYLQQLVANSLSTFRCRSHDPLAGEVLVHSIEYYWLKARLTRLASREYAKTTRATEEEWSIWMHEVAHESNHWSPLSDAIEDFKTFLTGAKTTQHYTADKVSKCNGVTAYVQHTIRKCEGAGALPERVSVVTQQLTSCAAYGGLRAAFVIALVGR